MSDRDSPPPLLDCPEEDNAVKVKGNEAEPKAKKEDASDSDDEKDSGKNESSASTDDGKSELTKKSSYYFFASTPAEEAAKYAPKQIDPNAATGPYTAPAPQPIAAGASAWNAAGTWEDRDVSSWAQSRLKELLKGLDGPTADSATAKITSVSKVEGDATILFVRGKKKIGYDLHVNATWKGEWQGTKVEGAVEIPSIADDNADEELEVRVTVSTSGDAADICRAVMKKAVPKIREKVSQFVEELKKQ